MMLTIFLNKVTETYFELGLALTEGGRDITVAKNSDPRFAAIEHQAKTKKRA
jgi:hypothetical protein